MLKSAVTRFTLIDSLSPLYNSITKSPKEKEEPMMKKLVCLVLALMLALCAMIPALAEGRKAPEDRKETVTELDGGNESHFRNYAPKF